MEPFMRQKLILAALIIGVGASLGGCWIPGYQPGGGMASRDLYTYESTPSVPQNLTVTDWTTGEKLLFVEIPVGQQLVVRFYDDYNEKNAARPALMRWKLMPLGTRYGELDNSRPVPGPSHRRLEPTIRSTAEAVPKAPVPAPEPVAPQ
jgi:hypothetical protein